MLMSYISFHLIPKKEAAVIRVDYCNERCIVYLLLQTIADWRGTRSLYSIE